MTKPQVARLLQAARDVLRDYRASLEEAEEVEFDESRGLADELEEALIPLDALFAEVQS